MENTTGEGTIKELVVSLGKPAGIEGREDLPIDFRDPIYEGVEKLVLEYPREDSSMRDIDQLPNLSSLIVNHGNDLDIGELIDLGRLKALILIHTVTPKSIGDLEGLEELGIHQPPQKYGFWARIPSGDWPALRNLHLSGVESKRLPKNFGGENLRRLAINNMYGSRSIPRKIWQYSGLETLDLASNRLGVIPYTIRNLKNLKLLNLRANQIGDIPDEIGELDNLETFDIDCNTWTDQNDVLERLPESIGNLRRLKHLLSYANYGLRDLPDSLRNLTNLRIYDFKDCPLTDSSRKILGSIDWAKPRVHESFTLSLGGAGLYK